MLGLVVLLEALVRGLDGGGNDEAVLGGVEGPEVGAEDHDAEGDVHVVVVLLHALFEGVREIFAQTHV